jgi:voltage-gated sodium channel
VFRAFRLVARLSVLKDLVTAIITVLPRLGSIMLLFALVLYIYAVLCTVLFGTHLYGDDSVDYFGTLFLSLFTLFQFVTLDNWGSVSREVMDIYPWAGAIFLSFLMLSSFILYSLVVAVVCDAVAVVEQ